MSTNGYEFDAALLTVKQAKALDRATEQAEKIAGQDLGQWHVSYQPESRPGRGHDISAWATDGEYMATQYLDPYGNGPLVVSAIEVLHNDGDDDHFDPEGRCPCENWPR